MSEAVTAVSASRWRFEGDGHVGRWWYKVHLEGARSASYEVEIMHTDGRRPLPFKALRSGRTTRSIGHRGNGALKERLFAVALTAIDA